MAEDTKSLLGAWGGGVGYCDDEGGVIWPIKCTFLRMCPVKGHFGGGGEAGKLKKWCY